MKTSLAGYHRPAPTKNRSANVVPLRFSAFELAQLATAVAILKGVREPAYLEAEEILAAAQAHLPGDWQVKTEADCERVRLRLGGAFSTKSSTIPSEADDIVKTLRAGESHSLIMEPKGFPASWSRCLRLITGEKDPRRRAPWLARAGLATRHPSIINRQDYRIVAAKLVPHLPQFGAVYTKKRATKQPRSDDGTFIKAATTRDEKGRVSGN